METCHHPGTCEQFREKFLDHAAATIVAVATAAHPHDPVAAAELALAVVGGTASIQPMRPMDTSDIDPGTGEEFGVIPEGQVWVEVVSTRDSLGRVAFRAYHADGTSSDYDMRLSEFERAMHPSGTEVKVLTRQQAAAFHAARTEATS